MSIHSKFLSVFLAGTLLLSGGLGQAMAAKGDPKKNKIKDNRNIITQVDRKAAAARALQQGALNPLMMVDMAMPAAPGDAPRYFSHPNYANSPLPELATSAGRRCPWWATSVILSGRPPQTLRRMSSCHEPGRAAGRLHSTASRSAARSARRPHLPRLRAAADRDATSTRSCSTVALADERTATSGSGHLPRGQLRRSMRVT